LICDYPLDIEVAQVSNNNWESMSSGPCTSETTDRRVCLYLGNAAQLCTSQTCVDGEEIVEIYKVEEPNINAPCSSLTAENVLNAMMTVQIDYLHPEMPTNLADSDTMFVDWTGDSTMDGMKGDIYLVTKNKADGALSRLVKIPVSVHEEIVPGSMTTAPFSVIPMASPGGLVWEGADMSTDGHLIALRDFDYVYFYQRQHLEFKTVAEALQSAPCPFASFTKPGLDELYETLALMDNRQYLTEVSECASGDFCDSDVVSYELLYASEVAVSEWDTLSLEDFEDL
jgi:hypothetical protein